MAMMSCRFFRSILTLPIILCGIAQSSEQGDPEGHIQPFNYEYDLSTPILFNAQGTAKLQGDTLVLKEVEGEIGTRALLRVLLPSSQRIRQLQVNGEAFSFRQKENTVSLRGRFSGAHFAHNQALFDYDPHFNGGTVTATFTIPNRIFKQLAERKKKWPIEWTKKDLECSWLAPERLLLYLQIAEPDWNMKASMTLDGKPLDVKKAYTSRSPGTLALGKGHNTFVGFYADISHLKARREYSLEVTLPAGLKPGQFQGVFFENVETEYTSNIVAKAEGE